MIRNWLRANVRAFFVAWRESRRRNWHFLACVLKGEHRWERVGERKIIAEGTWLEMEAPSLWRCRRCDAMAIS